MQCHHQTHLAEKRFFLSLYIEEEEPFLDKRIFLGLLERNESPLIIRSIYKKVADRLRPATFCYIISLLTKRT